ncbi:MAG TPA: GtrA family protein [Candidatus Saccharimonadia bacterium]|nr:GtrA family protein [Candidatus Saccharimonadia bacterium]
MKAILGRLQRSSRRYLIVGASVYVFELIVIWVAQAGGATPVWSVVLSFCLGTAVSFFLQKLITFGDKRMHKRVILSQALATTLLVVWNLGFSIALTKVLQNFLPTIIIRTLALGITAIWNFYLYKTQIFNNANETLIG